MNFLARVCVLVSCLVGCAAAATADDPAGQCAEHIAQWLDPVDGASISAPELFERISSKSIVLLGEEHDNADHHRWQHHSLAALHSRRANMMVGLEMLPRKLQAVLDQWSRGALDQAQFLEQSQWDEVWGYDADLYLPILHFARINRLPMIALNIDRQLVSKVGAEGWDALEQEERMGLSTPAPASAEYRRNLAQIYAYKMTLVEHGQAESAHPDDQDVDRILQSQAFANFVDAQLTWDRAMAEALADAHRLDPDALIVGIVGRGHLQYGHGIPRQLADLGIDDVAVLLPVDSADDCPALEPDLADAVFVVEARAETPPVPRPRLGVMIETAEGGVRVMEVVDGSVAAKTDIRSGDLIQSAAGFEVKTSADLIDVITRQAPGTWLPLTVRRGADSLDLVARFPKTFD